MKSTLPQVKHKKLIEEKEFVKRAKAINSKMKLYHLFFDGFNGAFTEKRVHKIIESSDKDFGSVLLEILNEYDEARNVRIYHKDELISYE